MVAARALAPDGSEVDGFVFDGALTVTYMGAQPVDAGIRVELELPATDDPQWLVPGVFYGENRPEACTRIYPRFVRGRTDVERMESSAWSFRADRCATPAVFARGGGLVTSERSPLGQSGVGLAYRDGRPLIWLDFPYREEPLRYDGSETPAPPDVQTYRWSPGESVALEFRRCDGDWRRALRDLVPEGTRSHEAAWVSVDEAAALAAWGLYRWHYRADPPRLLETVGVRPRRRPRRDARLVGERRAVRVRAPPPRPPRRQRGVRPRGRRRCSTTSAANLTPGGTFWPQWTSERGWTWGWHPDHSRAHARTVADAALFMLRAGGRWEAAARANVEVALRTQRADGALPAAHHVETGEAVSWEGTAGLSWIPALVEAGHVDEARRAGEYYAQFDTWYGAPEDVDLAPTSEDGYAAVMAFVALEDWETARRAADWMLTFRYSYDVAFSATTILGQYGFRTRGADTASPANQHLHSFGLICLPEMVRLARATGDDHYLERTRENLDCFRQFIAREDGDFDAYRGMATERYFQTDCFAAKGMLLTLSHAWSVGVLLYACEEALELGL